jgi:RHS repeat-associated protein
MLNLQRATFLFALSSFSHLAHAAQNVIGNIDGFVSDGAGHYSLRGWTCSTTSNESLPVHLYVNGNAGQPGALLVGAFMADQPSEQAVADACQANGVRYRFFIPLPDDLQKNFGGRPLYLHGLSPVGGSNNLLVNSGKYLVPRVSVPTPSEVIFYVHTDRLGSTVVLTDEKAQVVAKTEYKAYGSAAQGSGKPEAPGYTGHYEDPLTGLTYMQARYYDADLGRFLSVDQVASTPGDLFNFGRYGYANANPLSFIDPDGRAAMPHTVLQMETVYVSANIGGGGGSSLWLQTSGGASSYGSWNRYPVGGWGNRPPRPVDKKPDACNNAASVVGAVVGGVVTGGLTGAAHSKGNPYAIGASALIGGAISGGVQAGNNKISPYFDDPVASGVSSGLGSIPMDRSPGVAIATAIANYAGAKIGAEGTQEAILSGRITSYVTVATLTNRKLGGGAFVAGPMFGLAGGLSDIAVEAAVNKTFCDE